VIDITLDRSGNVLYASYNFHAVFRVTNTPATVGGAALPLLIAGSGIHTDSGGYGATDGPALAATFQFPRGITFDTVNNIAYIADSSNHRIRTLNLTDHNNPNNNSNINNTVTTLAGSTNGYMDAVGTAALFSYPCGIVYCHGIRVLYVADANARVRRIVVATRNVTTAATFPPGTNCKYICITANCTFLYITTQYTVVRVSAPDGTVLNLAGSAYTGGATFADGVGSNARINTALGIALNTDESALVFVDNGNRRIRKLLLATANVTTIAGSSGGSGLVDGPGPNATFGNPWGAKWYCNAAAKCGTLVADNSNSAIRFVALELYTLTGAATDASVTIPYLPSLSQSSSISFHAFSRSRSASMLVSCTLLTSSATVSASWGGFSTSASSTQQITASPSSVSRTVPASRSPSSWSLPLSPSHTISDLRPMPTSSFTRCMPSPSPSLYCALSLPLGGDAILQPLRLDVDGAVPESTTVVLVLDNASLPLPLVLTTAGVARSLLLIPDLILAVNLFLVSGFVRSGRPLDDAWVLSHVVLNVLAVGAFIPLRTDAVPFAASPTVLGGRHQFTAVFLSAPAVDSVGAPRWLPASLTVFRSTTLAFTLVWRGPADADITASVSIQVPCPGEVLPLATEVKAAGIAAQYSASLAGLSSGGAVGRVAAVRSLVLCSDDAAAVGLLPLSVEACDNAAASARGAVLGNLLLWAAAGMIAAAVAAVYAQLVGVQFLSSVAALGLPSPLLPLVSPQSHGGLRGRVVRLCGRGGADGGRSAGRGRRAWVRACVPWERASGGASVRRPACAVRGDAAVRDAVFARVLAYVTVVEHRRDCVPGVVPFRHF
jgi:hypothetical protein